MYNEWKALFVGDIIIKNQPAKNLVDDDMAQIIAAHDIVSCNFEAQICAESAEPIPKAFSPHECMHSKAGEWIKDAGFNVISMANNHMYDYGQKGLAHTLNVFKDKMTIGAGLDFESAYALKTFELNGLKIGFMAFCEAEFGALTDESLDRGGYAWINHPSVNYRISDARKRVDVLIIEAHTGLERVEFPLPEWRQRFKEFIDLGADAVIGHHAHIPQGWEIYKGKPIFYCLGHFYFEMPKKHDLWEKGIAVSLSFNGSRLSNFEIIPVIKTESGVNVYRDRLFMDHLNHLCRILEPDIYLDLVNEQLSKLWESRYSSIYTQTVNLLPNTGILRHLKDFLARFEKKYSLNKYFIDNLALLHNIRIESHRWSVQRALSLKEEKESYRTNYVPARNSEMQDKVSSSLVRLKTR